MVRWLRKWRENAELRAATQDMCVMNTKLMREKFIIEQKLMDAEELLKDVPGLGIDDEDEQRHSWWFGQRNKFLTWMRAEYGGNSVPSTGSSDE